jgi:TolA-binding protein
MTDIPAAAITWVLASANLLREVLGITDLQKGVDEVKIQLDTLMNEVASSIQIMQDQAALLSDLRSQMEQLRVAVNENDDAAIQLQLDDLVTRLRDAEQKSRDASQAMGNAASTIPASGEATVSGGTGSDTVQPSAGADTVQSAPVEPGVGVADDNAAAEHPAGV